MKNLAIFCLLFVFVSCATTPPVTTLSLYDRDEVSWFFENGTGRIEGDGFLRRNDGMLVKCAGNQVGIFPVSEYATERITNLYGSPNGGYNTAGYGTRQVDEADPLYLQDAKMQTCDVDGKFSFSNLPAGEYYVLTRVTWKINDYYFEGGDIARKVSVENESTTKVTLTN